MRDINTNIGINFDTTTALAQLRQLQAGLSRFNQSLVQGNASAARAQQALNAQLVQAINSTGKFVASQKTISSSTAAFTTALEKNQLSLKQYFRYSAAAATANTKLLTRMFATEREILNRAFRDRVKAIQSQYIQLNASQGGLVKALQIMPRHLMTASSGFNEYATRVQLAAQRQQIFSQLIKQGSTQLLNFGKNMQWAGRQLMVGLTIPLVMFASSAAKSFREMEKATVSFKRVYGDVFTSDAETNKAVENIRKIAMEFTKFGVAAKDTMDMAAKAAAAGFQGEALNQQVTQASKLAVLGQIDQQQALDTTISLQNAFGVSTKDLAKTIDFLNMVENQTVLSLEDITTAIPKVGPVVKQLGGNVQDLTYFLTAMRENGVSASQAANALKSGLASIINPTKKASDMLAGFGINIKGLVQANVGNLSATVYGLAKELDRLAPLDRARAIEQLFGKFQFARISALFSSITKEGSQASRVFQMMGRSTEEMAILSQRELKKVQDSVGVKFQAAIEKFKVQIMPIGKAFLEALTPVLKFFGNLMDKFNNLGDGTKKAVTIIIGVLGMIGPVALMTFGLLMNGFANLIKIFGLLRSGIAKLNGQNKILGGGFDYLTQTEIENMAQSNALHTSHKRLIDVFNVEKTAVMQLAEAYALAGSQARTLANASPGLFIGGTAGAAKAVKGIPKFATGTPSIPGPKGAGDIVPIMASPGEAIIPAGPAQEPGNRPIISAMIGGAKFSGYSTVPQSRQVNSEVAFSHITMPERQTVNQLIASGNFAGKKLESLIRMQSQGMGNTMIKTHSSLGFDIPAAMNYSLNSTTPSVNTQAYIKAISKPSAIDTMVRLLEKNGLSRQEAILKAKEFRKSYVRELLNAPNMINDTTLASHTRRVISSNIHPEVSTLARHNVAEPPTMKVVKDLLLSKSMGTEIATLADVKRKLAEQGIKWNSTQADAKLSAQGVTFNLHKDSSGKIIGMEVFAPEGNKTKQLYTALVDQEAKQMGNLYRPKGGGRFGGYVDAKKIKEIVQLDKQMFTQSQVEKHLATKAKLENAALKVGEGIRHADGTITPVTSTTGVTRQPQTKVVGGSVQDTRLVQLKNTDKVLTTEQMQAAKREGFIRAAFRGKIGGDPGAYRGMTEQQVARAERKALEQMYKQDKILKAQENAAAKDARVAAMREKEQIANKIKADKAARAEEDARRTAAAKAREEKLTQRAMRQEKLGRATGPLSAGLGTVAMGAMMAGAPSGVTTGLFGASAVAGLAPMLMNPYAAAATAVMAVAASAFLINKSLKDAIKDGIKLGDAMSMSANEMQKLAEVTGTVSATEEANLRRQNQLNPATAVQRKYGQNVLGSEFGKNLLSGIQEQTKAGMTKEQVATNISGSLSNAIIQGIINTDQARNIAMALGEELKSYDIPVMISGKITQLFGPNGENLKDNPLPVIIKATEQSQERQTTFLKNAQQGQQGLFMGAMRKQTNPNQSILGQLTQGSPLRTIYEMVQVQKENNKLYGAAVEMSLNEFKNNQNNLDVINQFYDTKLKTAKTDKEIEAIEGRRKGALELANAANKKNLDFLIQQKDVVGSDVFNSAINAQVDTMYKEGPMKVFADQAKKALGGLKDSKFKTELQIEFASGTLDPSTVTNLVNLASKNENIPVQFDALITTHGSAMANQLLGVLAKGGANDKTIEKELKLATGKSSKEAQKLIDDLNTIADFGAKYGITVDINSPNLDQKLEEIRSLKDTLDGLSKGDTVTKSQIEAALKTKPNPELQKVLDNWVTLVGGSDTIKKTMILDFKTGQVSDEVVAAFKVATGQTNVPNEFINRDTASAYIVAHPEAMPGYVKPTSDNTSNGAKKADPYEFMLQRLKQVRNFKINSAGGKPELMRLLGGNKDITSFAGINQTLRNTGASQQFIDWFGGLDEASRKAFGTVKEGKLVLTDVGKAMQKAFDEAIIGDFNDAQKQTIREQKDQITAYNKLAALGYKNSEIQAIIADKAYASAIAAGKVSDAELKTNAALSKQAELRSKINALFMTSQEAKQQADNIKRIPEITKFLQDQGVAYETIFSIINDQNLLEGAITAMDNLASATGDFKTEIEAVVQGWRDLAGQKLTAQVMQQSPLQKIQSGYDAAQKMFDAYRKIDENTIIGTEGHTFAQLQRIMKESSDQAKIYQDQIAIAQIAIDAMQKNVDAAQRKVEFDYTRPIEVLNRSIETLNRNVELNINRKLQALQDRGTILSNDLTIIDHQAQSINDKYDAQVKALEQVSQINQDIIAQEKQRISLADALTQGDISAAAQAAQDARSQFAQSVSARSQSILDVARQAELDALKGPQSGLTSKQIAEEQYQIGQQTYKLEQDKALIEKQILEIQDQIYDKEQKRQKALDEIQKLEDDIYQKKVDTIDPTQKLLDIENAKISKYQLESDMLLQIIDHNDNIRDVGGKTRAEWDQILFAATAFDTALQTEMATGLAMAKSVSGDIKTSWDAIKKAFDDLNNSVFTIYQNIVTLGSNGLTGGTGGTGGGGTGQGTPQGAGTMYTSSDFYGYQPGADAATTAASIDLANTIEDVNNSLKDLDLTIIEKSDLGSVKNSLMNKYIENFSQFGGVGSAINAAIADTKSLEAEWQKLEDERLAALAIQNQQFAAQAAGWASRGAQGNYSIGGMVKYFANGGYPMGTDTVPAMLTPGEFIVSKSAVDKIGVNNLRSINSGTYNTGSVYNYSVGINVNGASLNADDVARAVIDEIKYIDSQRIRSLR